MATRKQMETVAPAADKKKALEAALGQIERQFGKGSVMRLGENANILSSLIVSGIVNINLYPLMAHTIAMPIPVFPLVGSIINVSLFINPSLSAFSIMFNAGLSFIEPAGLKLSSFANILLSVSLLILTSGVPPISSVIFFAIFIIYFTLKPLSFDIVLPISLSSFSSSE